MGHSLVESRLWGICGGFPTFLKCHVLKAAELPEAKTARRGEAVFFCMLFLSFPTMGQFNVEQVVVFFSKYRHLLQLDDRVRDYAKATTSNYLSDKSRADLIFMFLRTLFWRDKHVGFCMG